MAYTSVSSCQDLDEAYVYISMELCVCIYICISNITSIFIYTHICSGVTSRYSGRSISSKKRDQEYSQVPLVDSAPYHFIDTYLRRTPNSLQNHAIPCFILDWVAQRCCLRVEDYYDAAVAAVAAGKNKKVNRSANNI